MAKNKSEKQAQAETKRKQAQTKERIITALSILIVVITVTVIVAAFVHSMRDPNAIPTDGSGTGTPTQDGSSAPTVYVSISYPALQENGELQSSGGMEAYTSPNLRDALDKECADRFTVTYDDAGQIIAIHNENGTIEATDGRYFQVYETTTQGDHLLDQSPADIPLQDNTSLEIRYFDAEGKIINRIG